MELAIREKDLRKQAELQRNEDIRQQMKERELIEYDRAQKMAQIEQEKKQRFRDDLKAQNQEENERKRRDEEEAKNFDFQDGKKSTSNLNKRY